MGKQIIITNNSKIKNLIYTIRDTQVMLDSDLANFYNVSTSRLNEQVKRNKERFPDDFMFQLKENEWETLKNLKSQNATSSWGGRRNLPFVFTEQGVAGLSGVLKSETATKVHIAILRAFVEMRKVFSSQYLISKKFEQIDEKFSEYDENFNRLFNALEDNKLKSEKGIFFNGQVFDAYVFISDLLKSAKKEIILIDNYIDESVLVLLNKRNKNVMVKIYTNLNNKNVKLDIHKFKKQYNSIVILDFKDSHDRFLIIDQKTMFHIGASLKDLGKKWFAFSKMDLVLKDVLNKLQ